jgi:hypothetical protein
MLEAEILVVLDYYRYTRATWVRGHYSTYRDDIEILGGANISRHDHE